MKWMKGCVAMVAAVALVGLGGCMPRSVTLNFGPVDTSLRRAVVGGVESPDERSAQDKVAVIDVRGLIVDMEAGDSLLGPAGCNPVDSMAAMLERAEREPDVRAVVLRINSPGGSVTASDQVYRLVRGFAERTRKPVVASLGEIAASGGYYLALAADEIVVEPTSITASIGVIMPTVNVSGGLAKLGVVSRAVKSGVNKDMGNPLEPAKDSHYAILQGMVDEYYGRFRGLVVARRGEKLSPGRIDDLTDGRVVTGAEAARVGLADREGGLETALLRAREMAGVSKAAVVKYYVRDSVPPRTMYAIPQARVAAGARTDAAGQLLERYLPMATLQPGRAYYVVVQ